MTKAKKITVSKEVADAITELQHNSMWGSPQEILDTHIRHGWNNAQRKCLNALSVQEMTDALYGGYDVKPYAIFPEKADSTIVSDLVNTYKMREGSTMFSYGDGVRDGIVTALSQLGIKVKGINLQ